MYDPVASTWVTKTAPLTPVASAGVAVVSDTIYVIGGWDNTDEIATVQIYSPTNDSWTTGTPMPTARSYLGAASLNGRIYAVGGSLSATLSTGAVEVYNPTSNSWGSIASLPAARTDMAVVARQGGIYAIGGTDIWAGGSPQDTVSVYEPATNSWSTAAFMPTARRDCRGAGVGNIIYVIGGRGGTGAETANEAFGFREVFLPLALNNADLAPELIFHNGVVLTMEPGQPQAQAIALRGDRILAVGSNTEILALQGSQTQLVDLGGRTLLPGFIDSHAHRIGDRGLWGYTTPDEPIQAALELGWTSIHEMWVNSDRLAELRTLDSEGRLRLRVAAYLALNGQFNDYGNWYQAYQPGQTFSPLLRVAGVKITLDQEWGETVFFTQEQLNAKVLAAHQLGWQVAVHAFPASSIDLVLNAYESALGGASNDAYRHRIEHIAILRDDQVARMSRLGIIASVQLNGTSGWPDDPSFQTYIPPEQWPLMARFRDMLAAGVPVIGNTDAPWGTVDWRNHVLPSHNGSPLWALYEAATRVSYWGRQPESWQVAQTITVEQALELLTIRGAYATFEEGTKGSLAPGKYADLVILSDNPLTTPLSDVPDIQVLLTMVGGHEEYCAPGYETLCHGVVNP
jgi:predicted amidohydrolase YtcJ